MAGVNSTGRPLKIIINKDDSFIGLRDFFVEMEVVTMISKHDTQTILLKPIFF